MDLFKEVIIQYYDTREKGDPSFPLDFLPYNFTTNSREIIWTQMEEEFTRTLINSFNDFIDKLYRLYLLDKIISKYSIQEQDNLRFEFTTILLSYCLSQPNEWRSRVIYFSTHLCHQANRITITQNDYEDKLPEDRGISFKTLESVSKQWLLASELIESLNFIGNRSEEFKDATNDYRDKNQHRLPPSLEMGLTNMVKRVEKRGDSISELVGDFIKAGANLGELPETCVVYEFGSEKPLTSQDLFPILVQQGERMQESFYKYWNLVEEQDVAILKRITD